MVSSSLLSFASIGIVVFYSVSAIPCDPANYICSGRCPEVPPEVQLPNGFARCMKDSKTGGCVCWLKNDIQPVNSLFLCEARVNGSSTEILCQPPPHCFHPDSEPTCLVIPYCLCSVMDDSGTSTTPFEFGGWKPLKAIVKITGSVEKHADDPHEFSLKHLLFLLGFVITPLLCWCFLNFVNEYKCKRKVEASIQRPAITDRQSDESQRTRSEDSEATPMMDSFRNSSRMPSFNLSSFVRGRSILGASPAIHSRLSLSRCTLKSEGPPSYDDVMNRIATVTNDNGLPPTYEEAIQGVGLQQVALTLTAGEVS